MLEHLSIKAFAIIDELSLPFNPGLTVLTGETGAGKSIIVDALQAVLGDRVDQSSVRSGESRARVEAAFLWTGPELPDGIEAPEGEIIVAREIRREGRGRATVNGSMITIPYLKEMGERMVDLHGQHEHQSLLRTSEHLRALDAFAGLDGDRKRFAAVFRELGEVRARLESAEKDRKDRLARQDYLRFVTGELDTAGIQADEEEQLREEERILGAAEKLLLAASSALEDLYEGEGSALETVRRSASALENLSGTDARLGEVVEMAEAAAVQLEEAGHFLRDYAATVQADPGRLEAVHERLSLMANLKKKYGPTVREILETLEEARKELAVIEEGDTDADSLRKRLRELEDQAGELAAALSRDRKRAASSLETSVQEELGDLAMEKVRFSVSFQEAGMDQTGIDGVEFLISPNPGEPLMPLRRIASGGELSRVMLAVKRILAGADAVSTLVFDEVDAGIGGRVAAVLGRKLQDISRHHQVLCVTHLAPVAAGAHHHILVEKAAEKDRTVVTARYLNDEERVAELARMMGGVELSSGIIRSARELLEEARG